MQYQNPYMTNPYMQQAITSPIMQQMQQMQQAPVMQQQAGVRVSGLSEASNRLLMMYPANVLVPGFISDPLFDIDGQHFYTLSIENDGRRNFERFLYRLDMPDSPNIDNRYVSRSEFQELVSKVEHMRGETNGIPQSVQQQPEAGQQ